MLSPTKALSELVRIVKSGADTVSKDGFLSGGFLRSSIASKIVGDVGVYLLLSLVAVAAYYQEIWVRIPLMERFGFIPWLLFIYTYYLCSKFEEAQGMSKSKKTVRKNNYYYTLYWGVGFLIFHYLFILFDLAPAFSQEYLGYLIDFYRVVDAKNFSVPLLQLVGLIVAMWGMVMAAKGRIYLNGYWAIDIHDYGKENRLVDKGPYQYVRHPIYAGQNLLVLGTALVTGSIAFGLFFVIVLAMNIARARVEEQELSKLLISNDAASNLYEDYMDRTFFMYRKFF